MKYLALLKDSFREAVDTKVFYVMIGLSAVVILLVACIGFTPQPVSELSTRFTTRPLNVDPQEFKKYPLTFPDEVLPIDPGPYSQVAVEPLNGAPDRPSSPFRFHVSARYATLAEAMKIKNAPEETVRFIKERFGSIGRGRVFEVTAVRVVDSTRPTTVDYEVDTLPTQITLRVWPHQPDLFFGAWPLTLFKRWPLAYEIWQIEDQLVAGLGSLVAVLISVIFTSFFIPNMLRKGTIDLLLVKPLHRSTLLVYKYLGGLLFILLNTAVAVGGVWAVLGLRSGIWAMGFLLVIFIITFFFAILYSVSTLFSVLSGSPIVSIVMTFIAWVIFWLAGRAYILPDQLRQVKELEPMSEGRWVTVVKAIHFVLPRAKDLDYLGSKLVIKDLLKSDELPLVEEKNASFSWRESLAVDGIFIGVVLGIACLRFSTKDY